MYIPVVRSSMYEMFQAFDLPDPSTPNGDRNSTVVAPQALFMMNASLVLKSDAGDGGEAAGRSDFDDAARVREVYERALARPPAASDVDRALTFIAQVEKAMEARERSGGPAPVCLAELLQGAAFLQRIHLRELRRYEPHWNSYLNRTLSRRELLRVSSAGFGRWRWPGCWANSSCGPRPRAGAESAGREAPHFPRGRSG